VHVLGDLEDPSVLARDPARLRDAFIAADPLAAAAPSGGRVVHAPGRVNLIGEHTDYNDGFVLPAAISLGLSIAYLPTDDGRVEVMLAATGERGGFDVSALPEPRGDWLDYVAGTAWALREAGATLHGFRGLLASDLPPASGLSSSAALELASAFALSGDRPPALDPMTLAQTAQRAENDYVGVQSGLMDQFAVMFGEQSRAVLLDCRSLEHRSVPLPLQETTLVVCYSGSPRRLEASEYNARRAECERAVAAIAETEPGVRALRDVTPEMLTRVRDRLDETSYRRAEHVVTENARVLDTVAALEAGDLAAVGRLFAESHASLRDRYEVSSPELDALVDIAVSTPGVVAARLTGAGFGGCTVNLVRRDAVDALREAVLRDYPTRTGMTPRVYPVDAAAGAGLIG